MLYVNPSRVLFFTTLIGGVLISISSSSWFTIWLGLELNLISFIPLITSKTNQYSSEGALKYFLVQALGSSVILASAPSMLISFNKVPQILVCLALLLKMGAAPVHFWFPSVMQSISWHLCFVLMTAQKIGPMVLLSYSLTLASESILGVSLVLCALVGGVGGLNQTFIRKIMAYSSINHMAWMIASILLSEMLWVTYFMIYSLVTLSVVLVMQIQQIFHYSNLFRCEYSSPWLKLVSFISLLSLGGLPPFLGFFPKMLVVQQLTVNYFFVWLFFLLFSSLLTLYYYISMMLGSMVFSTVKVKPASFSVFSSVAVSTVVINFLPVMFPLWVSFWV